MQPLGRLRSKTVRCTRPTHIQVRTPDAILACSINVGAARFDRFDSLLGSIGTRCTCHRVPPWENAWSEHPGRGGLSLPYSHSVCKAARSEPLRSSGSQARARVGFAISTAGI
eukprot:6973022-Alexandrium_andersonii.AAC.1